MKTRGQLDDELYQLVRGKSIQPMMKIAREKYRKRGLAQLNNKQMEELIELVRKDPAYRVD